ncbi:MAG: hypothetical protein AB8B56_19855 [Crocinitomicaceae bacterium]
MKYISVFFLGVLVIGCSPKMEEEIKDFNDILPNSERDYDQKDSVTVDHSDTLEVYVNRFAKIGTLDSISKYEEDLFPDRFGSESMEKFVMNMEGEQTVFVKWRFSDSLRVTNALFNWLDCFGPTCKFIRVGEEGRLQRNGFQVLANDTVLIYIESESKLNADTWDEYFESREYELDWNYRMEQSPRGKVKWFEYIDEEKTPLKNEEL